MRNFCSIILVFILGGYFFASVKVKSQVLGNSKAESSIIESGNEKWRVSLSAREKWFDTNIRVERGATINISASGFVNWGPPPGDANTPFRVPPNGTRPPYDEDKHRFPMPDAGCGSLIMRVGNNIYAVGEEKSIKVNESGTIQLMINDDYLSDNSGSFSVEIEVNQEPNQNSTNSIVFSSQRDGNQEVYQLDVKTGRAANLSQSREDDGYPRCSPGGQKIAFATNRDGNWEIYLMYADGSGQQNLTRNRGGNGYMDWSPNGQTLVFASTRNGQRNNEIYTIRADGTGLKKLTNHPAEDVHPVWSPDGRKIAFASERDGNRQIYVMNADGTNLIKLMSNRWYDDYPAWSPDGSQIAFSSDRDSRASDRLDIYVANSDGANVKRIVSHQSDDRHPAWSSDGNLLAFASNRNGDRDIYTIRVDGTGLQRIFSSRGDDEHPHWCGNNTEEKGDTNKISYPSTKTKIYKNDNLFQLSVPDNWQNYESGDTVIFAPRSAYGDFGITHGAMVGIVQTRSSNLAQASKEYVSSVLQANNYLRQKTGYLPASIDGRSANVITLSGYLQITGKTEIVTIYTTLLPRGNLFYVALVSPEDESSRYKSTFSNVIRSIIFYPNGNDNEINDSYSLKIYNVDDLAQVYINGSEILQVRYKDNKQIDITNILRPGNNSIRFVTTNYQEGFTYGFEVYRNNESIFQDECGDSYKRIGCRGNNSPKGIVYNRTINIQVKR